GGVGELLAAHAAAEVLHDAVHARGTDDRRGHLGQVELLHGVYGRINPPHSASQFVGHNAPFNVTHQPDQIDVEQRSLPARTHHPLGVSNQRNSCSTTRRPMAAAFASNWSASATPCPTLLRETPMLASFGSKDAKYTSRR